MISVLIRVAALFFQSCFYYILLWNSRELICHQGQKRRNLKRDPRLWGSLILLQGQQAIHHLTWVKVFRVSRFHLHFTLIPLICVIVISHLTHSIHWRVGWNCVEEVCDKSVWWDERFKVYKDGSRCGIDGWIANNSHSRCCLPNWVIQSFLNIRYGHIWSCL